MALAGLHCCMLVQINSYYTMKAMYRLVSRSQTLYLTTMLGKGLGTCPYPTRSSADIAQRSAKSTFFLQLRASLTMAVSFSGEREDTTCLLVWQHLWSPLGDSPLFMERSQIFPHAIQRTGILTKKYDSMWLFSG